MNKNKTGIFLMMFLLFIMPGAGTGLYPDTVVLKARVEVSDDIVRMKDIALMDTPTRTRIGGLVIAAAPDLGNTTTIGKQEIYEKLIGNGVASPQVKGATSVIVLRKGIVVEPTFFKEKIHQYIVAHSRWKDGVEVEIVTSKAIVVPESGIGWQMTPANGQDFFGNILFKVKAISDTTNEEIYSNWIVAKLKINKPVAVSNRTIQKNEIISEGDIRWENREINALIKNAILDKQEIIGRKAGRIIRPNSVITESLMEKKLFVYRGGMATLVARLKGINATSTVKVLANGSYGDTVRVMNTQSKKIISAVVTGKNTLEVIVQ